jgi:hypothetical protein
MRRVRLEEEIASTTVKRWTLSNYAMKYAVNFYVLAT